MFKKLFKKLFTFKEVSLITEKGLKLFQSNGKSLNGKVQYDFGNPNEWQGVPGNGAYVAIEGDLFSEGQPEGFIVHNVEGRAEVTVPNKPMGVKCFAQIRVLGPYNGHYKSSNINYYFKNGKLNGLETGYHKNGRVNYVAFRKDGILNGPYKEWDSTGKRVEARTYKNGNRV
jgi:hypothetical protein